MSAVKLCKDCVHFRMIEYMGRCAHPNVEPRDLGTGELAFADSVRKHGVCGRAAKLFDPKPDYVSEHIRLQQQAMLGMQNLAQYQSQALQNRLVMQAPRAVAYGNAFAGLVSGYETTVAPSDITLAVATSAPAEWGKPAEPEPDIHPFLQEKPRSHWKFSTPDGWTVLAILLSGALVVTGAWMVLS